MTIEEMMGKVTDLLAKREKLFAEQNKYASMESLTDSDKVAYEGIERELANNYAQVKDLSQRIEMQRSIDKNRAYDGNVELRSFIKKARNSGQSFVLRERVGMSMSDVTSVQGITTKDIIETDRPDNDIFTTAGVGIETGVRGNKLQWIYVGGVEAEFANELAEATEKKIAVDKKTPIQQRLACRIRISNQTLENEAFDLQAYAVKALRTAVRRKLNFAATATVKSTENLYGPFAGATETGTYGSTGYVAGKQVGTYTTLSKEMFAEMLGKLASRNIDLGNAVFVMGAEDFYKAKVTPMDTGSGIMLMDSSNKILGVPCIVNNAINRATEKGAVAGHNIGLGDWKYLCVNQHGDMRLSVDSNSAVASSTDEVYITVNADFSLTNLNPDAFVLYSQTQGK